MIDCSTAADKNYFIQTNFFRRVPLDSFNARWHLCKRLDCLLSITCLENPCAAAVPDSGTELTISASTGCSMANCLPHCSLTAYTICPSNMLSDLAKYTYSKMQNACALFSGLSTISMVLIPCLVISIISPGNTSRTYWAPIERKPQDSEDTTQPSASLDSSHSPSRAMVTYELATRSDLLKK